MWHPETWVSWEKTKTVRRMMKWRSLTTLINIISNAEKKEIPQFLMVMVAVPGQYEF